MATVPEPPPPARAICPTCGSSNAPNHRFCLTCGAALPTQTATQSLPAPQPVPVAPAPVPAPAPAPAAVPAQAPIHHQGPAAEPPRQRMSSVPPPPMRRPSYPPPQEAAGPAISPMPVVALGGTTPSADVGHVTRTCNRCNGVLDGGAAFCKFCGAPTAALTGGASTAGAKRPSFSVPAPTTEPRTSLASPAPAVSPVGPTPVAHPAQAPLVSPAATTGGPATPAAHGLAQGADRLIQTAPSHDHDGESTERRSIPAGAPLGRIVVVSKDGGEGPDYPIFDRVDIGRTDGEVRFPDDRYLSPRHVRLTVRDRRLYLQDISTANGVYLRLGSGEDAQRPGFRPPSTDLTDGQFFLIGQQVLRFERIENEGGYGPLREGDTLLFGTPAPVRYGRLAQRTVEGVTLDVHHLKKTETYLGRESGDLVFMDDPFLSRRHAKILYETESRRFRLIDLGSSNGTFYKIGPTEIELLHGDQFRIGQQLLRVELDARQRGGTRRPSEIEGHRA